MTQSLFSPESLVGMVFLIIVGITLTGAFIATTCKKLLHSLAGFALAATGVGGIYYFLNSPFVSMMQILIYVGAVSITISFGIMLANPAEHNKNQPISPISGPIGMIVSALLGGGLILVSTSYSWTRIPVETDGTMYTIGIQLLTKYSLVFELVSILLLVAILGSLAIAKEGRN
ncbi:MAG: NADH-quinone oxidoreductase subunit J [Desulfotalea sp.]